MLTLDWLFPIVSFLLAFIFGFMTWVAKNVWRDRKKTQTFAFIAIVSTIAFMCWAWFYAGV